MKQIKIQHLGEPNKKSHLTRERQYSVYLGNDLTCYFKNKTKARAFIAETNRMLNQSAQELHLIYIDIWNAYRKMYFSHHLLFVRMNCRDYPVIIEKQFDFMIRRSSWENGNHYTFTYFDSIIDYLKAWIKEIKSVLKKANSLYLFQQFDSFNNRFEYLQYKLKTWGEVYYKNAPPCPYDFKHKAAITRSNQQ